MKKHILIFALLFVLSLAGILFLSQTISYNQEINAIEEKIVNLESENIKFSKQIALASSCEKIFNRAKNKGYLTLDLVFQNNAIALKR